MRAGSLRHRVIFEELINELDSDGRLQETWVPAFPTALWAEITALSGRELIAAQAVHSKVTTRIKVRYRPGFKAAMRGRHLGEIYNIEAVIPDPESRIRHITLPCSSGTNEG